jgi:hypothetical protein
MDADREANKDAMKNLSHSERKAMMEEKRTELEKWAKENGITLKDLRDILRGPHMMHHGGPHIDDDKAAMK